MSETPTLLGIDYIPLLKRLKLVLAEEPNGVRKQVAIELLTVSHALEMGNQADALRVAAGVHKHVVQLITQITQITY